MNMAKRHWSGFLIAALNCALVIASPAQEQWNAPYPEKTEALALKSDITRGESAFVICQGCHRVGALGRPDGSYPRLAGQHASVVIKQLTDVRSGRRGNPKMLPFADHLVLSVQEIADIAAYLQALPVPDNQGKGDGFDLTRGKRIYDADCAVCHGARGEGSAGKFYPRVSGQHYRYLLREGIRIREGGRRNTHPEMTATIRKYSTEEISAVSDYMSRLPATPTPAR